MNVRTAIRTVLATALVVVAATTMATLQSAAQTPADTTPPKPSVSLKIDVVLSRWQGEKKVSSLPFALYIVAPGWTPRGGASGNQSVRMGVDVPIGTVSRTSTSGRAAQARTRARGRFPFQGPQCPSVSSP